MPTKDNDKCAPGEVGASTIQSEGAQPPAQPSSATTPLSSAQTESGVSRALKYINKEYRFGKSQDGKIYAVEKHIRNTPAYDIDSQGFGSAIRRLVHRKNPQLLLVDDQIREIRSQLKALGDLSDASEMVFKRVAATKQGIEIDVGDKDNTRIAVNPGKVEILNEGSTALFSRTPNMQPFTMPAKEGALGKLLPYLNLPEHDQWLLIAWLSYTLAHAKVSTTSYVILVLQGDRGTGKSSMCNIVLRSLVDPNVVGIQSFPSNTQDFAIAAQNAHVLFFDNLRSLTRPQSDASCIASTSGYLANRMLYSNDQESVKKLHCALVLNGIHPFIVEPDLAQRCLTLKLQRIAPGTRTTETDLRARFEQDLPAIFRGILDLIAEILIHLPTIIPIQDERMLDFVRWLAATEKAQDFEDGYLQRRYSQSLIGAMRDSLEDDPLAMAVIRLAKQHKSWSAAPARLLQELSSIADPQDLAPRGWPTNPSNLSVRLKSLKNQLSGAGVDVQIGKRGKERRIDIAYTGRSS